MACSVFVAMPLTVTRLDSVGEEERLSTLVGDAVDDVMREARLEAEVLAVTDDECVAKGVLLEVIVSEASSDADGLPDTRDEVELVSDARDDRESEGDGDEERDCAAERVAEVDLLPFRDADTVVVIVVVGVFEWKDVRERTSDGLRVGDTVCETEFVELILAPALALTLFCPLDEEDANVEGVGKVGNEVTLSDTVRLPLGTTVVETDSVLFADAEIELVTVPSGLVGEGEGERLVRFVIDTAAVKEALLDVLADEVVCAVAEKFAETLPV